MGSLRFPLVLVVILSIIALSHNIISIYVGPLEYKGHLTYAYTEGDSPISNVVFSFDEEIGWSIIITNTPTSWSIKTEERTLIASGGSLAPGDTLVIGISFKRYIPPGERPFISTGTTTEGESVVAQGILIVSEMILLKIIYILADNLPLLLVAAIILLVIDVVLPRRKPKQIGTPDEQDVPDVDQGLEFPGQEGLVYPIDTGDDGLSPPEEIVEDPQSKQCVCNYEWMHESWDIDIIPIYSKYWLPRKGEGKYQHKRRVKEMEDDGIPLPRFDRKSGYVETYADEPLPLMATVVDKHALIQKCLCPFDGNKSTKVYTIEADHRIVWKVIQGNGGFIQRTDDDIQEIDEGVNVLFVPKEIPKPNQKPQKFIIKVTVYHNDETKPPEHDPIDNFLYLDLERYIKEPNHFFSGNLSSRGWRHPLWWASYEVEEDLCRYKIRIQKGASKKNPLPTEAETSCSIKLEWKEETEIIGDITLDTHFVAYGDYIKLTADANDVDNLVLKCQPTEGIQKETPCNKDSKEIVLSLNDTLTYIWSFEKGRLISPSSGQDVLWQAPDEEGLVRIKLTVLDKGTQFLDKKFEIQKVIRVQKLGIDLVKTPKEWLPDAAAGTLELKARTYLCSNGKWRFPGRKKIIRFRLISSCEPGVCMNYPLLGTRGMDIHARTPDLFFYEEKMEDQFYTFIDGKPKISIECPTEILKFNDNPQHDNHFLHAITYEKVSEATPMIRCEDYGAKGFLIVNVKHCVPIPPRESLEQDHNDCSEFDTQVAVSIPRDDNKNDIADSARQDEDGQSPKDDAENVPQGDGYAGDGLTNYEEYRGFIIGGQRKPIVRRQSSITIGEPKRHVRTDTRVKDLFLYDEDKIGYGMLNVTGLNIHTFYDPNLFMETDTRIINFNHGRHHGGFQHGLWLRNFDDFEYYVKSCGPKKVGTPKDKTHICVNIAKNSQPSEPRHRLANSIARGLSYGLNINNHGDGGNHNCTDGKLLFTANRAGGETSGNMNCYMRYDNYAVAWCHGEDHQVHLYAKFSDLDGFTVEPNNIQFLDSPGTTLCNSREGTGLNKVDGHNNRASRGNCRGQLRVKDW